MFFTCSFTEIWYNKYTKYDTAAFAQLALGHLPHAQSIGHGVLHVGSQHDSPRIVAGGADITGLLQPPQHLAHSGAITLEYFHHIFLAGQSVARLKLSAPDQLQRLLKNHLAGTFYLQRTKKQGFF